MPPHAFGCLELIQAVDPLATGYRNDDASAAYARAPASCRMTGGGKGGIHEIHADLHLGSRFTVQGGSY